MYYKDLKKNKITNFSPSSRITCSLWEMPLSNEKALHWHDYFTIDIIVEGNATSYTSFGQSAVSKGYMHLVLPSDIHHVGSNTGCKLYSIRFPASAIPENLEELFINPVRSTYLTNQELFSVSGIANSIIEFASNKQVCQKALECILLILKSKIKVVKETPSDNLKRVLDYLDLNFRDNPSLEEAAKIASYSTGYFSYIFKKSTGYTFSQYLTSKKLNYACAIMIDSSLTLSKIADLSGFPSFVAFNRAFKAAMGVSPREYRKNNK